MTGQLKTRQPRRLSYQKACAELNPAPLALTWLLEPAFGGLSQTTAPAPRESDADCLPLCLIPAA